MAGHAPRIPRPAGRWSRRIDGLSDLRISIYMWILAALAVGIVYTLDRRFFG